MEVIFSYSPSFTFSFCSFSEFDSGSTVSISLNDSVFMNNSVIFRNLVGISELLSGGTDFLANIASSDEAQNDYVRLEVSLFRVLSQSSFVDISLGFQTKTRGNFLGGALLFQSTSESETAVLKVKSENLTCLHNSITTQNTQADEIANANGVSRRFLIFLVVVLFAPCICALFPTFSIFPV